MAPQEVAGLQALAKAHGGSLTVNPDTGLAEAGFLSSILPMVAGAGLSLIPGVGPMMAAGIVGGGMTLATGSLQKGLMAGLGAYGGAGLAGGLMGAGAAGAAGAGAGAGLGATETAMASLGTGPSGALLDPSLVAPVESSFALGAAPKGALTAGAMGTTAAAPSAFSPVTTGQLASGTSLVPTATSMPVLRAPIDPTFSGNLSQATQGFKNLGTEAGRDAFLGKAATKTAEATGIGGYGGLAKYGLMGLAPVAMDMLTPKQREIAEKEKLKPYEYEFSLNPTGAASGYRPIGSPSGYDSSEMQHFDPRFVRKAAGGGLMDIGPIEAMSNRNQAETVMANGGQMFAEGGETKAVKPVEQDPYYTMTGQSGDVFKYLMGQGSAPTAPARAVPAASTGMSGFLGGITGIASPEGIQKTDGTFVPWSDSNPKPTGGGLFGNANAASAPIQERRNLLGRVMGAINPGAGGYYEDDTSGRRDYTFDPNLGGFREAPVPKRFVPYEADTTTAMPGLSYENMNGGMANGGIASLAQGGASHLGDYSDGGRLLKGPGDGVSDDIPATIGEKRPARLADGEFVVPARIVSELGNGSTEAGARKLYAMMDRVQSARKKSIGKDRVAVNSRAEKLLPA
jgi:hypothetical protein